MKIGFIGLGNMGTAMAANLLKAGYDLTVYNRTPEKTQPLVAQGARRAASVMDACTVDVVITMLADDQALESVAFDKAGILEFLPEGSIHLSCSTISVALSDRLTSVHTQRSQGFVSAPVFGRPEAAVAAKLYVVASGDRDSLHKCQPIFDAIGQRTFLFGDQPSKANLVKLSGNFLIMHPTKLQSQSSTKCSGDFAPTTSFAHSSSASCTDCPARQQWRSWWCRLSETRNGRSHTCLSSASARSLE